MVEKITKIFTQMQNIFFESFIFIGQTERWYYKNCMILKNSKQNLGVGMGLGSGRHEPHVPPLNNPPGPIFKNGSETCTLFLTIIPCFSQTRVSLGQVHP